MSRERLGNQRKQVKEKQRRQGGRRGLKIEGFSERTKERERESLSKRKRERERFQGMFMNLLI